MPAANRRRVHPKMPAGNSMVWKAPKTCLPRPCRNSFQQDTSSQLASPVIIRDFTCYKSKLWSSCSVPQKSLGFADIVSITRSIQAYCSTETHRQRLNKFPHLCTQGRQGFVPWHARRSGGSCIAASLREVRWTSYLSPLWIPKPWGSR